MLDIRDYYGRKRALCGGSLGPPENLGWAFAHLCPSKWRLYMCPFVLGKQRIFRYFQEQMRSVQDLLLISQEQRIPIIQLFCFSSGGTGWLSLSSGGGGIGQGSRMELLSVLYLRWNVSSRFGKKRIGCLVICRQVSMYIKYTRPHLAKNARL